MYGRSTSLPTLKLARRLKPSISKSASVVSTISGISVRASAKRDEVLGAVNAIQVQSAALMEDIQGVRERLPPQLQSYFESLAEILYTGDTYASALGVSFGDYRDGASGGYYAYPPRGLATTSNINMLEGVRNVLQWMDDLPVSIYPEVRRLIADIIGSYKPLSNALWAANGVGRSILTGTVELYDTAGEINTLASRWVTEPIGVMATDLCTEYVTHSGYRRLRKTRAPGVHCEMERSVRPLGGRLQPGSRNLGIVLQMAPPKRSELEGNAIPAASRENIAGRGVPTRRGMCIQHSPGWAEGSLWVQTRCGSDNPERNQWASR